MAWLLNWLKATNLNKFFRAAMLSFLVFGFGVVTAQDAVSFDKRSIKVGSQSIQVEIASSERQLSQGLMFRKMLPSEEGMLFIFPETRILSFWMKNTFIPLSIGFFDENKKLIEVLDMKPSTSVMQTNHPSYVSSKPARYALEMNQGWFKKRGIKPGDVLDLSVRKNSP